MQISVINTSFTSLYASLPSSVVFACKTATFGENKSQVSMGLRSHLWFLFAKQHLFVQNYVSMGPRLHLWFFHAKQGLLEQNNKSLLVPDMTCHFVHVQQRP